MRGPSSSLEPRTKLKIKVYGGNSVRKTNAIWNLKQPASTCSMLNFHCSKRFNGSREIPFFRAADVLINYSRPPFNSTTMTGASHSTSTIGVPTCEPKKRHPRVKQAITFSQKLLSTRRLSVERNFLAVDLPLVE